MSAFLEKVNMHNKIIMVELEKKANKIDKNNNKNNDPPTDSETNKIRNKYCIENEKQHILWHQECIKKWKRSRKMKSENLASDHPSYFYSDVWIEAHSQMKIQRVFTPSLFSYGIYAVRLIDVDNPFAIFMLL